MKKFIILLFFILIIPPQIARADDPYQTGTIATFICGAIQFDVTGNYTSSIDPSTGNLTSTMAVNYKMITNSVTNNLQFKAEVKNSLGTNTNAIYSLGGTASSQNLFITFGNNNTPPTSSSISNCQQATSTPSANVNAIAYPANLIIDNSGVLNYNNGGYINVNIKKDITNMTLTINPTVKSGTYDSTTADDDAGTYIVGVYIDNIP